MYSDVDILQHAMRTGYTASSNGRPVLNDEADVVNTVTWLQVLAIPRIFCSMNRMPPREHILHLVDIYIEYVRHDGRYMGADFEPVPYETREPLALKLRELLSSWIPPELPTEITEAARALLYAEGLNPAGGWDTLSDPEFLPEEHLLWPEGVPALMSRDRGEPSGEDALRHHVDAGGTTKV